jgi:hypothetical protein
MATDLSLLVFDPDSGAIVYARWLGGNGTLASARDTLARPPTVAQAGLECWTNVLPDEAREIARASYSDGGTPDEVMLLSARFPAHQYRWMIVRDF